jgi:ketosteroid isomerase-like protein
MRKKIGAPRDTAWAVSGKNAEVVRDSLNLWVEIDEGLAEPDRMVEFWAPDITLSFEGGPEGGELHSLEEMLEWRANMAEPYDDWNYSPEKILDAGEKRVVATFHARAKPRGSDAWVDWRYGIVYTVEEGLITDATMYPTQENALEAAGLRE